MFKIWLDLQIILESSILLLQIWVRFQSVNLVCKIVIVTNDFKMAAVEAMNACDGSATQGEVKINCPGGLMYFSFRNKSLFDIGHLSIILQKSRKFPDL